ncbi:MAG: hypothetical protein IJ071_10505 [Ruminococcus sp.]|nr:hypothetical protein [Ruminococcus sp.]
MIKVIPICNAMILPYTVFIIRADKVEPYCRELPDEDDDVLFVVMKEERELDELRAEDIYPMGARAVSVEYYDDLMIFEIGSKIELSNIIVKNGRIGATIKEIDGPLPDTIELSEREALYLKSEEHRIIEEKIEEISIPLEDDPSLEGVVSALSPLMDLSAEERYLPLAENDLKERDRILHGMLSKYLETSTGYYNEKYLEMAAYDLYSNYYRHFGYVNERALKECGKDTYAYLVSKWFYENQTYTSLRDISSDLGIPLGDVADGIIELAEKYGRIKNARKHISASKRRTVKEYLD